MNRLASALKVHAALTVRDMEASIGFYRRLFGVEPSRIRPGYAKFDVRYPLINLSLNQGVPTGADTGSGRPRTCPPREGDPVAPAEGSRCSSCRTGTSSR